MYQQTTSRLIVPRTAGLQFLKRMQERYGRSNEAIYRHSILKSTWEPNHPRVQMKSNLRDYQVQVKELVLRAVRDIRGCVLAAHCSFGKTVTLLHIQHTLGGPMICLVPNNAIAKQWGESIKQHVSNAVVFVKPTFTQISSYQGPPVTHIVLTVQSVIAHGREALPLHMLQFYDKFSTLVVDEAHFIPAAKFRTCINILGHVPYRIALTATPDRDDGHHNWLFAAFGPIAYQSDPKDFHNGGRVELLHVNPFDGSKEVEVEAPPDLDDDEDEDEGDEAGFEEGEFEDAEPGTQPDAKRRKGTSGGSIAITTKQTGPNLNCYIGRVQAMVMRPGWNNPIVDRLHTILTKEPFRCTIVLTFFTQHALLLRERFTALGYQVFSLFKDYRDVTNEELVPGTILIASYSLGSTGNDFKNLNTLVLASPMKKIEQSVGRILRNPVDMYVLDVMYSGNKTFRKQLERREKAYAYYGFNFTQTQATSVTLVSPSDSSDSSAPVARVRARTTAATQRETVKAAQREAVKAARAVRKTSGRS